MRLGQTVPILEHRDWLAFAEARSPHTWAAPTFIGCVFAQAIQLIESPHD
jgi:hypothetical protein